MAASPIVAALLDKNASASAEASGIRWSRFERPPKTRVWTGVSGAVWKLRYCLSISERLISAITAVTGSCQTSVTPASSTSSRPEMISTQEMSRTSRRSGQTAEPARRDRRALEHPGLHRRSADPVPPSEPGPA